MDNGQIGEVKDRTSQLLQLRFLVCNFVFHKEPFSFSLLPLYQFDCTTIYASIHTGQEYRIAPEK